ncbi:MAG: FtsH protease activity modulator HflK [Bacteriovoracales bacterium]|nr:FtsH protease activity modulator HflK [Bacteriovoracales bacterium]
MNEYDRMRKQIQLFKKFLIPIALFFVLALGSLGSFYTVQPDEQAVIIRLGRYSGTYGPGLHFKLPFGIDKKFIVKTELIHQMELGFRTTNVRTARTQYSDRKFDEESLMLTGDLNVADVEWVIQFRIGDAFKFIFNSRTPEKNLRDVAESIMRRVVGDKLVSDVLTTGKAKVAIDSKNLMQEVLDKYDIGIKVVSVQLQKVSPPESVKQAFNEVNEAKQEQEKLINQAEEQYNKVIPNARGQAEKQISRAKGYADALLNTAKGDAHKFESVLRAYKTAPDITRKRIYLETMEKIFQEMDQLTVVDKDVKGVLPIFGDKIPTK